MSMQFYEATLLNGNIQAFLKTIRKSEGTDAWDGYGYLFGSSPHNTLRFTDFSKHPDIEEPFGKGLFSSAAGAYQILYKTWLVILQELPLPDFSPHSQDLAALVLISGKNCLELTVNGMFNEAVNGCANIWASLPNNNYGQPEHSIETVTAWYISYGGVVND